MSFFVSGIRPHCSRPRLPSTKRCLDGGDGVSDGLICAVSVCVRRSMCSWWRSSGWPEPFSLRSMLSCRAFTLSSFPRSFSSLMNMSWSVDSSSHLCMRLLQRSCYILMLQFSFGVSLCCVSLLCSLKKKKIIVCFVVWIKTIELSTSDISRLMSSVKHILHILD